MKTNEKKLIIKHKHILLTTAVAIILSGCGEANKNTSNEFDSYYELVKDQGEFEYTRSYMNRTEIATNMIRTYFFGDTFTYSFEYIPFKEVISNSKFINPFLTWTLQEHHIFGKYVTIARIPQPKGIDHVPNLDAIDALANKENISPVSIIRDQGIVSEPLKATLRKIWSVLSKQGFSGFDKNAIAQGREYTYNGTGSLLSCKPT